MPNAMSLPTLNTDFTPQAAQGNPMLNAMFQDKMRKNAMTEERAYQQNVMTEERTYQEKQKELDRQVQMNATALNAALKASNPEQAKQIYMAFTKDDKNAPDFSFVTGGDVKLQYPDGHILEGPQQYVQEAAEAIAGDPSYMTDPEKQRHTMAWMATKGVNFQAPQPKEAPASIQGYEYAKKQGYAGSFADWEKSKTPSTNVSVNVGEKGFSKLAEEQSKGLMEEHKTAQSSARGIAINHQALDMLDEGMITGFGADWLISAGKALNQIGFNVAKDPIANSEAYGAMMGKQTLEIIKGLGSSTAISDADREYADMMSGRTISLTEESLRKIIDINERASREYLRIYNEKAGKVMERPEAKGLPYDLRVDAPKVREVKKKVSSQGLIEVTNPDSGQKEVWDTKTKKRVR